MAFIAPALAAVGSAVGASAATATAVGAVVASTAVATLGVGASALASANAASYQADLARSQAKQAQEQAAVKAGEVAREGRQRLSAARAGALQNGFELSGSMNDLLDQADRQDQLDYLTAVYDGSVQATGLNASAKLYKSQATNALIGGALGMGSKALGGVADVYRMRGVADVYRMRGSSISVSGT